MAAVAMLFFTEGMSSLPFLVELDGSATSSRPNATRPSRFAALAHFVIRQHSSSGRYRENPSVFGERCPENPIFAGWLHLRFNFCGQPVAPLIEPFVD
jgi:hypothetical protein